MDPENAEPRSHVEMRSERETRVVVMTGEFDIENVSELRAALDPETPGIARFVLDVSGVTFADSTALSIMLQPALNRPVVLVGEVPDRLARLLEITGADLAFAFAPTMAEALATTLPRTRR
ncbi:STAS domain-containing protein [Streptomyces sp. NPDC088762]|uniref:STAS domain-containing protein n=1 Tax=Streptomyces sp. NPDC088762 TaxID=3365891 RepID=UPI00381CD61B